MTLVRTLMKVMKMIRKMNVDEREIEESSSVGR
jgi:hypothetical protein